MEKKDNTSSSKKGMEVLAKTGLCAKGMVYCIMAIIAFNEAFSLGSKEKKADKNGIFSFVYEQKWGTILLTILALGLVCFCVWRFIESFMDTEDKGTDKKGLMMRTRYFLSGLAYSGFAFYAIKVLVMPAKKGGGDSQSEFAGDILNKPFGQWVVAIIGIIIVGIGLYQIYYSFSGKYKKHVDEGNIDDTSRKILLPAGKIGYIARGVTWLIIGWLFIKSGFQSNASDAGGTNKAFNWLKDSDYGSYLLAAVAIGLFLYGIYMFVRARYQPIHV